MQEVNQTEVKVRQVIHTIYANTLLDKPFSLIGLINSVNLTHNAGIVIRKMNIIRVVGKKGNSIYKWIAEPPTEKMIKEISEEITAYQKIMDRRRRPKEEIKPEEKKPVVNVAMPAPLQFLHNSIDDKIKQQNEYLKVMGAAIEEMRTQINNLHKQFT